MVRLGTHDPIPHKWGEADFVGGHPALDFLNTVADTSKDRESEKIPDWDSVRAWAARSGLLSPAELERFLRDASLDGPDELAGLHRFRESAYAAMLHLVANEATDAGAMEKLCIPIRAAIERGTLERHHQWFAWRPNAATSHRWKDAAALTIEQLLRSDDLTRVRQCGRCTWFFIDRGRGSGRRWCDMRTCGNRAKGEAFRTR